MGSSCLKAANKMLVKSTPGLEPQLLKEPLNSTVAVGPSRGRKIVKAKKVENEPAPPTPRTPSPAKEEEINDDKVKIGRGGQMHDLPSNFLTYVAIFNRHLLGEKLFGY
jgi:hypothetical protein